MKVCSISTSSTSANSRRGDRQLHRLTAVPADVLCGLSGGVDSAVAALLLVRAGLRVHAVTFSLWVDPAQRAENRCCSAEGLLAARRVAEQLGIAHELVDLGAAFFDRVVTGFVAAYAAGRTPNPCVRCNARVRIPALLRLADELGIPRVATGHYARMLGDPPRLHRARHESKDQSYVLAGVDPALLERVVFPLGELDKHTVRRLAREAHLESHSRPDSQEICFIPDNNYRRFVSSRVEARPGPIVDLEGNLLGHHAGIHHFTIGQRKGLGIAAPRPLYVVAIQAERATVVVGPAAALPVHTLEVRGITWHQDGPLPQEPTVQIRSTGVAVHARVLDARADVLLLDLAGRERAAAPGQTAVVYDGSRVVCAGTITRSGAGLLGPAAAT